MAARRDLLRGCYRPWVRLLSRDRDCVTLTQLAAGDWIRQGHNLILGGPTGSGKTSVACALAHQACRQHQSVLYRRVPELVAALIRARGKGTLERLMGRLGRVSLLVLDDWGCRASPPRDGATCWRSWRRAMDASPF